MDFSTPESLSYGQRKALACAAKCADLLNSYDLFSLLYRQYFKIQRPHPGAVHNQRNRMGAGVMLSGAHLCKRMFFRVVPLLVFL